MPGITIHDNASPLKGAVLFLNAALKVYLDANSDRKDAKFNHIKEMMQANLYLTDLRGADVSKGEKYNEIDLVSFKKNGDPVCFTLQANAQLTIAHFKEAYLEKMSSPSQEMAKDIKEKLGFTGENANSPSLE